MYNHLIIFNQHIPVGSHIRSTGNLTVASKLVTALPSKVQDLGQEENSDLDHTFGWKDNMLTPRARNQVSNVGQDRNSYFKTKKQKFGKLRPQSNSLDGRLPSTNPQNLEFLFFQ